MKMEQPEPKDGLNPKLLDEARDTLRQERPSALPPLDSPLDDQLPPTPVGDTGFFIAGEKDHRVRVLGTIEFTGKDGKNRVYRIGPMADQIGNKE